MIASLDIFASPTWAHVMAAVAHTLWQGAAVSVLLILALRMLPARRANLRYLLCCLALLGLVAAMAANLAVLECRASGGAVTSPVAITSSRPSVDEIIDEVKTASAAAPATPNRAQTPSRPSHWAALIAPAWLLGVGVMLLRTLWLLTRANRLCNACVPLEDSPMLETLKDLRLRLGIKRPVRIMAGEHIDVPATLGILAPVVLLPLSAVTGAPPDYLRAALAHELAHICRFDYAVNLLQMLIEALLFFNPAVWWISRQIRIERESCCDAAAARAMTRDVDYARALAGWVAHTAAAGWSPAQAMSGGQGSALERIRRLLTPGYRPSLSLSWLGALALVLGGMTVLAGVCGGSFMAVLAAKALTPQERLQRLEKIAETHEAGGQAVCPGKGWVEVVPVSGQVRTCDGSPLPDDLNLCGALTDPGRFCSLGFLGRSGSDGQKPGLGDGSFSQTISEGTLWLCATAEGYAPQFAGPFEARGNVPIEKIDILLERGFSSRLKVTTKDGTPIGGALLKGYYAFIPGVSDHDLRMEGVTDAQGLFTIDHCASVPIKWTVTAAGYQKDTLKVTHKEGSIQEWALKAATPASGVVVSKETGEPIPGAILVEAERWGGPGGHLPDGIFHESLPETARTDKHGRFVLTSLEDGLLYTYLVVAPGGGRAFLRGVEAGATELSVRVGPPLYVRGVIHGALERLKTNKEGQPVLAVEPRYMSDATKGGFSSHGTRDVPVRISEGVGHFEITGLWPGDLVIRVARRDVTFNVSEPIEDCVLELPPEEEKEETARASVRAAIVRLKGTGNAPARGAMTLRYIASAGKQHLVDGGVPITDGEVRIEMLVPGYLTVSPAGVLGYWFPPKNHIKVSDSDEPYVVELDTVPAGSIFGRVTEADGSPAKDAYISVRPVGESTDVLGSPLQVDTVQPEVEGENPGAFMVTPLPLDRTYAVVVHREHAYAASRPIHLDAARPTRELSFTLAEGMTVSGQILASNGQPVTDVRVGLDFKAPAGGYGGSTLPAQENGQFSFEHVDPRARGSYDLRIETARDFQGLLLEDISIRNEPLTIRLEPGLALSGRLIDDTTGRPVVHAMVDMIPDRFQAPKGHVHARVLTDEDGAFSFTNLAPIPYVLYVQGANRVGKWGEPVTPGTGEPIEVRVTIPDYSGLLRPADE